MLRRKILALVKWIILISGGITMVFPFYWMVITSIKIQSEVMKIPPVLFPTKITLNAMGESWVNCSSAGSSLTACTSRLRSPWQCSLLIHCGYVSVQFKYRNRSSWGRFHHDGAWAVTMIPLYLCWAR